MEAGAIIAGLIIILLPVIAAVVMVLYVSADEQYLKTKMNSMPEITDEKYNDEPDTCVHCMRKFFPSELITVDGRKYCHKDAAIILQKKSYELQAKSIREMQESRRLMYRLINEVYKIRKACVIGFAAFMVLLVIAIYSLKSA